MSITFWPVIQQLQGGPYGSPVAMARDGQWTIVAADCSVVVGPPIDGQYAQYFELPPDCEVGDLIEIHFLNPSGPPGNQPQVSCPSGEAFNTAVPIMSNSKFYRKLDSTTWGAIG